MNEDAKEAIERARGHLEVSLREGLQATRALIEAARAAGGISETTAGGLIDEIQSALDRWIASLEDGIAFEMPNSVAEPLERALRAEIARWEKRSETDEAARPVLRVFLGLRELLWELGMRGEGGAKSGEANRGDKPAANDPSDSAQTPPTPTPTERSESAKPSSPRSAPRVQRFAVED